MTVKSLRSKRYVGVLCNFLWEVLTVIIIILNHMDTPSIFLKITWTSGWIMKNRLWITEEARKQAGSNLNNPIRLIRNTQNPWCLKKPIGSFPLSNHRSSCSSSTPECLNPNLNIYFFHGSIPGWSSVIHLVVRSPSVRFKLSMLSCACFESSQNEVKLEYICQVLWSLSWVSSFKLMILVKLKFGTISPWLNSIAPLGIEPPYPR